MNGKQLVSIKKMVQKIKVIKETVSTLFVVARTDARAVEGLEASLARATAYIEAGADAIFPEALQVGEELELFIEKVSAPMLANMTEFGKTPYYTAEEFTEMGIQMVIYPVTSLRATTKAYENIFKVIKEQGTQKDSLSSMQTRKELYEKISYYKFEDLDSKMAKTILPEE